MEELEYRIKKKLSITKEQAIKFYNKKIKSDKIYCLTKSNANIDELVAIISKNNIPFKGEWNDEPYNKENLLTLDKKVTTFPNCNKVEYTEESLIIKIYEIYYIDNIHTIPCLKRFYTINAEDINETLDTYLIKEFYINELIDITQKYYTDKVIEKLIDFSCDFVKKDIEELVTE